MKPLKIKKSDNLKKELSKIKGGCTPEIKEVEEDDSNNSYGQSGQPGPSGMPGLGGNAGCNLENSLEEQDDLKS